MARFTHIVPMGDPTVVREPYRAQGCPDVVCPTQRIICRRDHTPDCEVLYGCGADKVFYCRSAAHDCDRRFKCTDFRHD